ncbi:MAG: hypothetical protein KAH22_03915 [Thiotrichaceae bacterium]|nr:hypothetical protein [Thiotrichaceae bacterium]
MTTYTPFPDLHATFQLPFMQEHAHNIYHVTGKLLAILSSPKKIPRSEWLIQVLDQGDLPSEAPLELKEIISALQSIRHYWIVAMTEDFTLPPACHLDENGFSTNELMSFCDGYVKTTQWLYPLWADYFDRIEQESPNEPIEIQNTLNKAYSFCQKLLFNNANYGESVMTYNETPHLLITLLTTGYTASKNSIPDEFSFPEQIQIPNGIKSAVIKLSDPCRCGSGKRLDECCIASNQI